MTRSSHSQNAGKSKTNYPQGNSDCPTGQFLLPAVQKHLALVDRQWIADKLSVNQATVCRWISGEKKIPSDRYLQILQEAKCFHNGTARTSMDNATAADQHIDLLMKMQFGRVE
jgi:hypothetical protein